MDKLDLILEQLGELKLIVNAVRSRANESDARLEALTMDMHQVKGDVKGLSEEMNNVKEEIKGIKVELKNLKEEIHVVKSEVIVVQENQNRHERLMERLALRAIEQETWVNRLHKFNPLLTNFIASRA